MGPLLAYFHAGQYERALAATQSRTNPELPDYIYRPLIYARLGRKTETAAAISELSRRDPEYSAERWLSDTGTFSREADLNLFVDSHRKAGLQVCATEAQLQTHPDMKRLSERARS